MSVLIQKIRAAEEVLMKVLPHYSRPVVMSSFGKDSMVLLEIVHGMQQKFPVLFHKEPFFPKKFAYANEMIARRDYEVHDYPPSGVTLINNGPVMEILNWYNVGQKFMHLPTGVKEPEPGGPFLCGLKDIYHKARVSSYSFPWDLVLVGHKSSDVDVIFGSVPLNVDLKKNEGGPDYLYPLRHFTDADIWDYHRQYNVPVNEARYDPLNSFRERPDISANNDYFPACTRCMDRTQPATVHCPLIDQDITNISADLIHTEPERPAYIGGSKLVN